MVLAIDIGNTDAVLGLFSPAGLCESLYRFPTRRGVNGASLAKEVLAAPAIFLEKKISLAVLSSVVPETNSLWREVLGEVFKTTEIFFISHLSPWSFRIGIDAPEKVGHDRLCNMEAALRYGESVLVVDAGTATKFDLLENGIFRGGAIAPGLGISFAALVGGTSQLASISLEGEGPVVGRNTEEALRSGAVHAFAAQVDGMIEKIIHERVLAKNTPVIATGGFSRYLQGRSTAITYFSPNHTLEGLNAISQKI